MPGLEYSCYVSTAARSLSDLELEKLLRDARAFNHAVGVTGVLLFNGTSFFQYFEGAQDACARVYTRIRASRTHHSIIELCRADIASRQFAHWAMGYSGSSTSQWLALSEAEWVTQSAMRHPQAETPEPGLQMLHAFWQAAIGKP